MKSEHRHELKTNELGRLAEKVAPYLEKHSNHILIGLGIAVVIAGVSIFVSGSSGVATAGWTAMFSARSVEDYGVVADKYPNIPVGAWARLSEAENYLAKGIQFSFTDRASALSDLKQAREMFEELVDNKSLSEDVRKRALLGLARCAETTTNGNTDEAIGFYDQLINEFEDPVFNELAEKRIAVLRTDETKDFYTWFHKQSPKPADREQPRDGGLGDLLDPGSLPSGHSPLGEVKLPEIPSELKLPEASDEGEAPALPAEDDSKPADKTDAEKQPEPKSQTEPKSESADQPDQPK